MSTSKHLSLDALVARMRTWRDDGNTVVFTNGCFDLLHDGHRHLLHEARRLGDRLVVGLNSDGSVRRLKGEGRPVNALERRIADLCNESGVDAVVVFEEDTPEALLEALRPDVLVKGGDYTLDEVVGRDIVESYGGRVATVSFLPGHSTTGRVAGGTSSNA